MTVHAWSRDDTPDPAHAPFLALLEADLAARPSHAILPLTESLVERMTALVGEQEDVDFDAPIDQDSR